MPEEITLSTCALKLRNSDPEIFELFVNELEKYYDTLMDAMVQSGINDVLVAQGRTHFIIEAVEARAVEIDAENEMDVVADFRRVDGAQKKSRLLQFPQKLHPNWILNKMPRQPIQNPTKQKSASMV